MARAFLLLEALNAEERRVDNRNTAQLRRSLRNQAKALELSEAEFKAHYRLTKELFIGLCNELKPYMTRSQRKTKVSVENKVLTALSFYATGSYQKPMGMSYLHGLSQASVSSAIKEVTIALNQQNILSKYIKFPQTLQERQLIINKFSNKFGFPGCLGCIDGTHVALLKPTEHEERFFNRKHFHSRNVQIVCDSDLYIMNIDATFGGATHDAYIWRNCEVQHHIQNLYNRGEAVWLLDDQMQLEGPLITPLEEDIILQKGQNYTINCKGQNPLQFKQQEVPEEATGQFSRSQRIINSTEYNFEIALDLYNVDEFAIGYYACFDDTINATQVLHKVFEEPQNTEHITYIYVYVNGTDKLIAPMREIVKGRNGSKIIIECRPTTPDVKITLIAPQSNKTQENAKFSPKIGFMLAKGTYSAYRCIANLGNQTYWKPIRNIDKSPPVPDIIADSEYFIKGENFSMKCNVTYQSNESNKLHWVVPNPGPHVIFNTNVQDVEIDSYINNVTVLNAGPEDAGYYSCISTINSKVEKKSFLKVYHEKGFVILDNNNRKPKKPQTIDQRIITFKVKFRAYPEPDVYFLRDGEPINLKNGKYDAINNKKPRYAQLNIRKLDVTDTGNYTIVIRNDYENVSVTNDYRIKAAPVITFEPKVPKKFMQGTEANLLCTVTGYPLPSVRWRVDNSNYTTQGTETQETIYKIKSIIKVPVREALNITCEAGTAQETRSLLVYEIYDGFGIQNKDNNYQVEGHSFNKKCYASLYDFSNVTWIINEKTNATVSYSRTKYSHVSTLSFESISTTQAGQYSCKGTDLDGTIRTDVMNIVVDGRSDPQIDEPLEDQNLEVKPYQPVSLECTVTSKPKSILQWTKDGINVINGSDENIEITDHELSLSTVKSTLQIKQMAEEDIGKYECVVLYEQSELHRFYNLVLEEKVRFKPVYVGVIGLIMAVLTILVLYLAWKIRKEKRFRKDLAAAGLLYFKEGRKLNPNLGIDEQAELLPYDDRFEFPREKLTILEPLGSGAYGEVLKAEAQGIVDAERTDIVAVKRVKKTADNMCIKALTSELKIMVHLGKHVNIVNLLGACTKDVVRRELIVIVEYCEFGNLYHYLQKHREVFIDQLTENKEKCFGNVNRAYSCSTNSAGTNSEYFGRSQTHETEQTFLNTGNSSRSGRRDNQNKEADVVQASEVSFLGSDGRSSIDPSNYSYEGRRPRPLYSRDLLAWAFQIARGMEYLTGRKVLHGDLALRNILLAKDNVVKICDFGLARSVRKNDEYQKQENSLLPVKWLAIECMTDRIFSTQSDVWAFGIVLWELFTLAKTPYPNINPAQLLQWLLEGNRLDKPAYADDKLYDVMNQCWQQKPTARPSFSRLQEIIGSFLEENVRNHYVDLNTEYMDLNFKREGEDYLAMVTAPDYNCMVTPSPHHYVNHDGRSFFPPTPLPHDDEGYLAMSPAHSVFSPRFDETKFVFDAKELNSERNSHESTPMLTLNNLPARSGSDSDHEGNLSPYQKMCPRIEEESDEVFDLKQNNEKNASNTAVDNPTYITMTADSEIHPTKRIKNANNITNSYINMPNGLVK